MNKLNNILFLILLTTNVIGQVSQFGFGIGTSNTITDLGLKDIKNNSYFNQIQAKAFKPSFNLFYTINFNPFIANTVVFNYFTLYGNDKLAKYDYKFSDAWFRNYRNLNFIQHTVGLSYVAEVNLFRFTPSVYRKRRPNQRIYDTNFRYTPYAILGVGLMYNNPKRITDNGLVRLRPKKTENTYYSPVIFNLPIGIGFKYQLSKKVVIKAEYNHIFTFSDYIDDVSTYYNNSPYSDNSNRQYPSITSIGEQRGNSNNNDQFINIQIGVSYIMNKTAYQQRNAFKTKRKPTRFYRNKKWRVYKPYPFDDNVIDESIYGQNNVN